MMRRGNFQHARQRIDAWKSTLRLTILVHLLSVLMLWTAPPPGAKGEHFFEGNHEAWRALEKAHEAGKLRAIGVSNFQQADLDNILDNATVRPAVKKVLAHVGNTPFDLIEYSRSKGIRVEAYSPVAYGAILNNTALAALANRYGVSGAQLCIRYSLELGLVALPKTSNPEHMRSNASVDFQISEADMGALKKAQPTKS